MTRDDLDSSILLVVLAINGAENRAILLRLIVLDARTVVVFVISFIFLKLVKVSLL